MIIWTEEDVQELIKEYRSLRASGSYDVSVMVDKLSTKRNKTSVINKLVKLKVYQPKPKKEVITKKTLVIELNSLTGLELWSFIKVNKSELVDLLDALKRSVN